MEFFDGINHPSAATVIADGLSGGMLYAGTPADSLGKDFTAAQYADYKAHGLVVGLVYESVSGDFLGGAAAGAAHARDFWNDCAAKGVHTTDPAGSTVDQHVTTAQIPTVVAYQRAFRAELRGLGWTGPIGVYGFSETLTACHDNGVADWFWGAGTRSSQPPYTNIWQDNTGTIQVGGSAGDRDWVLVPLPTGADMNLTDPLPDPASVAGTNTVAEALTVMLAGIGGKRNAGAGAVELANLEAEDVALLSAIKAVPAPVVQQITADPVAVATALESAGLPTQIITALLALLAKTAPTGGTA